MIIEIYKASVNDALYDGTAGCYVGEIEMDSLFAADMLFAELREAEREMRGAAPGCKSGCFVRCVLADQDTKKFFRLRVNRALEAIRAYIKRNRNTRWPRTILKRIKHCGLEAW